MTSDAIAEELIGLLGTGEQVEPFSARVPDFGMGHAYDVVDRVREARQDRGEMPVGRKIGFTNRAIWDAHGIDAPIWNWMYDTTVQDEDGAPFTLGALPEPRIEPEIVLHLTREPKLGMNSADLIGCIDWIAPGFEIVFSIFPGWRLTAADATAAYGVHGGLVIGERREVDRSDLTLDDRLAGLAVTLQSSAGVIRHGRGSDVLGSPLEALRFLVEEIARHDAPPLATGEIVTTGTLTEAMPTAPGETWIMESGGMDLPRLTLSLS